MAKTTTINNRTFTIVNENTQAARDIISRYNYSNCSRLYEAYGSYSCYKARAEQEILQEMAEMDGYSFRITGAGSCFFSCAYKMKHEGSEYIVFHTPSDRKLVKLA